MFGLHQLGYQRLNSQPTFENWRKSVKSRVLILALYVSI